MSLAPGSPRLPSPPPPAENQISPNSPSGGATASPEELHLEQTLLDASSRRRIHPGTKAEDMSAGPPLIPLQELDSAFQLQEHLAALHCYHTASNTQPLTRTTALQLAQPPPGIDRTIWLYELCRFLISQCNSLIVGFLFDTPPCSASTCPEMRASEWQFLCAVHEQPKSCCAIDYCCHTLDWAANVVTDQKIFPSRFVVLSDTHSKNVGIKNLVNVFRRLHRIFAHAWFQHRGVFWTVEGQTGLYVFFKTVCDLYDLLPAENYKLPPEAEGLESPPSGPETENPPPSILKPPTQQHGPGGEDDNLHPVRTNTRRHIRSSPSTGSAVTTVIEAEEEEPDGVSRRLKDMSISGPMTVDEEPEMGEVPVIVEQSVMDQASAPSTESAAHKQEEPADDTDASDADETVVGVESQPEPELESAATEAEKEEPTPAADKSAAPDEAAHEAAHEETKEEDPAPQGDTGAEAPAEEPEETHASTEPTGGAESAKIEEPAQHPTDQPADQTAMDTPVADDDVSKTDQEEEDVSAEIAEPRPESEETEQQ